MISVAMATDLTVVMRDTPGELAKLGEVTLAAGVRLRGLAAFTGEGRGFVHALVDDGDVSTAEGALKQAKIRVADRREVIVVELGSRSLADVMTALAEANVNVDLAYTACDQKVVIATDDVLTARDALS
jgi:hypothetical protein